MNNIEVLKITRQNMLNVIADLSLEQLNKIPEGFNNNIAWNIGHVVVTQQLLTYGLSGLTSKIDNEIITRYRKGSKPDAQVTKEEIEFFKENFFSLADQTEADFNNDVFKTFKTYPTSFGVELTSIEDAIEFNNVHEGLHLGTIMALRKLV